MWRHYLARVAGHEPPARWRRALHASRRQSVLPRRGGAPGRARRLAEDDGGPRPDGPRPGRGSNPPAASMADLPDETVAVLRVAAVIGREFDLRVLERTSRLGIARLLDVLGEAVDAGVIVEGSAMRRYAFVHELVRETLYDDLPPSRRLELHQTIGAVARGAVPERSRSAPFGDRPPLRPGDAAGRCAEAAIDYLVRAGDRAEHARLRGGRAPLRAGARAPRRGRGGTRRAARRAAPAPRRRPLARRRHEGGPLELRGGPRSSPPPGGRGDAGACGAGLRDRARRLPAVRPLRGGGDRRRAAGGGARGAPARGQPAPGAAARAPRRRDVRGERGRAARRA